MKTTKTINQIKKTAMIGAISIALGGSLGSVAFAESGNALLKNDSNPINTAVEKTKKVVNDTMITSVVKAKLVKSRLLNGLKINVETEKGDVRLSGNLDTDMQYEEAVMLAESTDGVENINAEQLKVKDSQQPLQDTYVTAKVKGQLLKDKIMGENVQVWPVSVETKNGVVYLKGKVDSEAQKNNVLKAVNSVSGIKSVKAEIEVSPNNNDTHSNMNSDTNGHSDSNMNSDNNQ